jgi:hypothetical protein
MQLSDRDLRQLDETNLDTLGAEQVRVNAGARRRRI